MPVARRGNRNRRGAAEPRGSHSSGGEVAGSSEAQPNRAGGGEVGRAFRAPAIRSMDIKGCGYNLKTVQRVSQGGTKWVLITPPPPDPRLKGNCFQCNGNSKTNLCCIACRTARFPHAPRTGMALRLAELAAGFGQPIHLPDRLCRLCLRIFWSGSCPDHLRHHHHQGNMEGAAAVIALERVNGWVAVEEGQVPAQFIQNVQELQMEDGHVLYPVCRLPEHLGGGAAVVAIPQAHLCGRPGCLELQVARYLLSLPIAMGSTATLTALHLNFVYGGCMTSDVL
ncbi:hypothetical protein U9M48_036818 [Paspalum notatum var. saurae]|uniref:Uncharacterized protein n=1 Tax=Paspalum notatum var. saurae TaxID=547442 RepID=A0AAQ3UDT7_PASNO